MSKPPFSVRSLFPYESDIEDDLTFEAGQIITVEVIEDQEWYSGSYTDPKTQQYKTGMFPQNFVEIITEEPLPTQSEEPDHESEPESSHIAQSSSIPASTPASVPVTTPVAVPAPVSAEFSSSAPVPVPASIVPEPSHNSPSLESQSNASPELKTLQVTSSPPAFSPDSTTQAPPKKKNAFQDRIAAFNSSNAAPSPFTQPKPTSYAKKPFYAAPSNSYVPHIPSIPKQVKSPQPQVPAAEIVHYNDHNDSEEEQAMPKVSLKERIKLLQQQQQAEAARSEALANKKKHKSTPKKPEVSEQQTESEDQTSMGIPSSTMETHRDSLDSHPGLEASRTGESLAKAQSLSEETPLSKALSHTDSLNDSNVGHSNPNHQVTEEGAQEKVHSAEEIADEEEEESEEDEEDEEEARRLALRERMAKISGGMGMHLGMIMPGGFGGPAPPIKPKKKKAPTTEPVPEPMQAPVAIFPFANPASLPSVLQHPPKLTDGLSEDEDEDARELAPAPTVNSFTVNEGAAERFDVEDSNSQSVPSEAIAPEPIASEPVAPQPIAREPVVPKPVVPEPVIPQHAEPQSVVPQSAIPLPSAPQHDVTPHITKEPSIEPVTRKPEAPERQPAPLISEVSSPPRREQGLSSVIANHKEDSEESDDSDGVWSDSESGPSRPAPTKREFVLPPTTAPSVPEVQSLETEILDAYDEDSDVEPQSVAPQHSGLNDDSMNLTSLKNALPSQDDNVSNVLADQAKPESQVKLPLNDSPQMAPPVPPHVVPVIDSKANRLSYTSGSGSAPPVPSNNFESFSPRGPPPPPPASGIPVRSSSPDFPENNQPFEMPDPIKEEAIGYDSDSDIEEVSAAVLQDNSSQQVNQASVARSNSHRAPPPPPPVQQLQDATPLSPPHRHATTNAQNSIPEDNEQFSVPQLDSNSTSSSSHVYGRASLDVSSNRRSLDRSLSRGTMSVDLGRRSMDNQYGHAKRVSMDNSGGLANIMESNQTLATEFDLQPETQWWFSEAGVPPTVASREDVTYEIEETERLKRGGKRFLVRDIYVLFTDCSQNIITVEFSLDSGYVSFQQRIEAAPPSLRQDQLELASATFGNKIASNLPQFAGQALPIGQFIPALLHSVPDALPVIGNRTYGALLYHNLANASVRQFDEIRPGDIAVFRNAKFHGHKGGLRQKYSHEAGVDAGGVPHAGVVYEWDGTKQKIKVYEQIPEGSGMAKIKSESYKLRDLKSGEVKVFRVVGREYVGWN